MTGDGYSHQFKMAPRAARTERVGGGGEGEARVGGENVYRSGHVVWSCGEDCLDGEGELTRCEIHQMHRGCTEEPGMGE